MKKFYSLISILSVSAAGLLAQTNPATPNSGFENWTAFSNYTDPVSWESPNSQTATYGSSTCAKATAAADVHSGLAACELTTLNVIIQVAPGIVTTGTLPTSNSGSITGGIAYTLRPDSMIGWYKYTPQKADHGFVSFMLFGTGLSDTVAMASFNTPNATIGKYTRFSAPLIYRSNHAVTNSIWIGCSSFSSTAPVIGSTLFLDDLGLILNTTSIDEKKLPDFRMGPNPAIDHLEIQNPLNAQAVFILYDVTGRKLEETRVENASTFIDIHSFPNGLYLYSIMDENNKVLQNGKIVVQK